MEKGFNWDFPKSSILEKGFFMNNQVKLLTKAHRYQFFLNNMEKISESDFITKIRHKKYKS